MNLWANADDIQSRCYLNLEVEDTSGVIADVTSVLKDYDVSIEKFLQPGLNESGTASLVIITHMVNFQSILNGVEELGKLSSIIRKPKLLRLEEV